MSFDPRRLTGMIADDAAHKYAHTLGIPFALMVETSRFADCAQAIAAPQPANANKPDPQFVLCNAYRENNDDLRGVTVEENISPELAITALVAEDKIDIAPSRDVLREFAYTSQETLNAVLSPILNSKPQAVDLISDSIDSLNPTNVVPFKRKRKYQFQQF
jgi:hypothetical protein